ncbi:hypothetical protein UC35_12615 [Ramlibacter tataouinensis]|uniref:DUF5801 domain-containing protein n=1 Tax=Ramlibacter tataouinensis TaxID=94132 RepID=A0A127JZP3_9BURK|nr:hypothetical protein UC35_12615 [Ramlibacter tataouinensis]
MVDPAGSSFGVDGQAASGATTFSLAVSTAGVSSGLTTNAGTSILLFKEGDLVIGRIGSSSGAAAFAVAINASTGVLSMAQYSAVKHANTSDPNDQVSVDNSALLAVVNVKDGDGDTNSASVAIGNQVRILDDGPALAFGNLIGTGTITPQLGAWSMAPGVDQLGANGLDIAMTGFQLVKPDNTTVNGVTFSFEETAPSPDASGNYHFSGSITADLDNNPSTPDITEHFTMTAFTNGTYNIDLVEGFQSSVTFSTASGQLKAGSPDPVKTLLIPPPPATTVEVVFFSVAPGASTASVQALVGSDVGGAYDPTEEMLQGTAAVPPGKPPLVTAGVIDTREVVVSTSGIGVDNNVFQGDGVAGIGGTDESFVVNPTTQVTSVKVNIDNSVGGYNFTGAAQQGGQERLFYNILFVDGTTSGTVLVTQDLGLANKGQPTSFTINGGGKLIDAIQFTMAFGDVKIPSIEFTTETQNLVNGIRLAFTAGIADGDGDSASSSFVANLSANALNSTFDYILNGAASALDWFNVDLTLSQTKYQVNGFDVGTSRDKLVLLGNAGATFGIDNTGADAIVTVNETGGQTTTITVVGVDLLNTDVALV